MLKTRGPSMKFEQIIRTRPRIA